MWIWLFGRDGNLDQLFFLDKELLDLDKGLQNQNEMKKTMQLTETYTESIWTREVNSYLYERLANYNSYY